MWSKKHLEEIREIDRQLTEASRLLKCPVNKVDMALKKLVEDIEEKEKLLKELREQNDKL